MTKRKTRAERLAENRVARAFPNGVGVPVLDLEKVFQAGLAAIKAGATDAELRRVVYEKAKQLEMRI